MDLVKQIYNNKAILLILLIGSLFSAHRYNIPWEWPLIDFFTSIERMLNKDYLKNDFTTNTFDDYSARFYLSYFYAKISEILDVHYTIVIKWFNGPAPLP